MNLLERARRAQAARDDRDAVNTDEADQRERAALADWAIVILDLDPPVNAAMLRPVFGVAGRWALYRFEYEGMRFVTGRYRDATNPTGESGLLAVQLEQVRGRRGHDAPWPQWPPPRPSSVATTARWAPAGYYAIRRLADLADALDQSTLSTGEPC